jgi:uncharacterized linocin/CFP29 family protein
MAKKGTQGVEYAGGDVFERLLACNMDVGALRPYRRRRDGKTVVSLRTNQIDRKTGLFKRKERVLSNVDTTLTRDVWEMFDSEVIDISRPILSAWNDLRASAQLVIPDGMGTIMLTQQRRGDITPATRSMDGLRKGLADQPEYDDISMPLPITHKDFHFSARDIAVSARGGSPLDKTNLEMAAYWVADAVEEATIGSVEPFEYGGSAVYGYQSFPQAATFELTSPEDVGWIPDTLRNEVLEMMKLLFDKKARGPYSLMYGPAWMVPMGKKYDEDDSRSLENVLKSDIPKLESVTLHEKLTGYKMILRERQGKTSRAVVSMDIQVVQWETEGGMKKNFKVLCILNPQQRADMDGNCGLLIADVP